MPCPNVCRKRISSQYKRNFSDFSRLSRLAMQLPSNVSKKLIWRLLKLEVVYFIVWIRLLMTNQQCQSIENKLKILKSISFSITQFNR